LTPLFRKKARDSLVKVGLWEEAGGGAIIVHDYAEWNRSNESKSASARNAAQVRWERERQRKAATGE
jgi:hypothetical protein